jgi:hypothetical protein
MSAKLPHLALDQSARRFHSPTLHSLESSMSTVLPNSSAVCVISFSLPSLPTSTRFHYSFSVNPSPSHSSTRHHQLGFTENVFASILNTSTYKTSTANFTLACFVTGLFVLMGIYIFIVFMARKFVVDTAKSSHCFQLKRTISCPCEQIIIQFLI